MLSAVSDGRIGPGARSRRVRPGGAHMVPSKGRNSMQEEETVEGITRTFMLNHCMRLDRLPKREAPSGTNCREAKQGNVAPW